MNDELFIELRETARKRGMSVRDVINNASLQERTKWFPNIATAAEATKLYRDYKDAHFYRLYHAGKIEAVHAERRRVQDAEHKMFCESALARTSGRFSSTQPNLSQKPKAERDYDKMVGFGFTYGQSPTRRMSSTAPSFQEFPKQFSGDAMKVYDEIRNKALAFDFSMLEESLCKPDPRLEAMRKRVYEDMIKIANPLIVMKCAKPRPGVHDSVFIDVETYSATLHPDLLRYCAADINATKELTTMNSINQNTASYPTAEALREQLAAAEAREAAEAARIERDAYLASLENLATQTGRLVSAIRFPSNNRLAFGKAHLKALKALADELGAKIQPTNDAGYYTVLVG